jgi:hypothetical protein
MAVVSKQDSNRTELRYAVEISPATVDGTVTWYALEPNSYKGFGGEVKTKARMPINASRQYKKGVVVDLDAAAEFEQDLTYSNFQDLSQTFFCAALRTKSELDVATVDGSGNDYEPTTGGTGYTPGDLLFAKGFDAAANNGLKVVTGQPVAASVPVTDTGLVAGATQTGIISRVGYQFGSGLVEIDVSGDFPILTSVASQVAASGTLDCTASTIGDGDTVTIAGQVYTFESGGINVAGEVLVGASDSDSLDNLIAAINGAAGAGTTYGTGTPTNAYVSAAAGAGDTVTLTALVAGAQGNSITTTTTIAAATLGATLSSGAGAREFDSFGLIPGEFVFVGGDQTAEQFATAVCNGFCRVREVTATEITFDKTQAVMTADNGSGKTIRIFFGRVVKNESDADLIITRSIQLERTLGAPDDSLPTEIQAEYLTRALGDKVKFDVKTADIVTTNMEFVCNTNELRSGATGVKTGTRATLVDTDAFNSTSDVAFTKMAIVTDADSCPDPLFAYFTDFSIMLNNNISQNKAVSVLGTFDSTLGFFQVQAELTAYFTDIASIQAVKDNESVTIETHFVKFNKGVSIDLPLTVMSQAEAEIKINEPVMIPLSSDAATAKSIDADLDYTMLMVFWDYLPDLAG